MSKKKTKETKEETKNTKKQFSLTKQDIQALKKCTGIDFVGEKTDKGTKFVIIGKKKFDARGLFSSGNATREIEVSGMVINADEASGYYCSVSTVPQKDEIIKTLLKNMNASDLVELIFTANDQVVENEEFATVVDSLSVRVTRPPKNEGRKASVKRYLVAYKATGDELNRIVRLVGA